MWKVRDKILLEKDESKNKKIVSNIQYGEELYIGLEDGTFSCYKNNRSEYTSQYFTLKFDYLESCDVLEKITSFDIMETGGLNKINIVSNEKNIKIFDVRNTLSTKDNLEGKIPETYTHELIKEYSNVHSYMCNSISLNNDNQYFITSDYLVINLWKPDILEGCYTLVDIKPHKHSELVYVINTAKFSKYLNTIFGYSTTNGVISLNDLRLDSLSKNILKLSNEELPNQDGAFKSISDFSFVNEHLIVSRSLNDVTLFDMRNPSKNIFCQSISEKILANPAILQTDAVYEKFKIGENGKFAYTGSFDNKVYSIDLNTGEKQDIVIDAKYRHPDINKTRFITAKEDGFYVVYGNIIYDYVETEGS